MYGIGATDDPFEIVEDSSLWRDVSSYEAVSAKDPYIRTGIVKKIVRDASTKRSKFLVEVNQMGRQLEISCDLLLRSGGAYNYEETMLRGYKIEDKPDEVNTYSGKPGDMVVVACLNGEFREGLILGFILHPSRSSTLSPDKGPQHINEFNGVETHINESGEFKLTFKGLQKNLDKLKDKPAQSIEAPQYDEEVGGSFLKFDKTGGFILTDSAKENTQSISVDKANGSIIVVSGKVTLSISKKDEKVSLKSKILDINSETSVSATTKDLSLEAKSSAKIKSPKVAIGSDGTELLDQIAKLIDALGKVQPISPVGPCTPIQATPQWADVMSIKSKIKEITGSL